MHATVLEIRRFLKEGVWSKCEEGREDVWERGERRKERGERREERGERRKERGEWAERVVGADVERGNTSR
jgi:hypothetical protein